MKIADYDTTLRHAATVVETNRITPADYDVEIRHLVLRTCQDRPRFSAGHILVVFAPPAGEFGNREHQRFYTVASAEPSQDGEGDEITICVRRCFYIDEVNGERYPGIASNYLCDVRENDVITIAGPYNGPFQIPPETDANLIMIGIGTGMAPFRAFIKQIYEKARGWNGKVRLFYGAHTGMELLYMNDVNNDIANYYDEETFQAFTAISEKPHLGRPVDLGGILRENATEVWALIQDDKTYVYVAGLEKELEGLHGALARIAGSEERWEATRARLGAEERWSEILY